MDDREHSVQYFLDLIKKSHRGKFKVYIGMIAGVGKSYRMLQEAHELLENGVNVQIGYIETHGRAGTEALLQGLPVIPRRKIFYKGKELEEMDLDTIIRVHPEIVIVDELAHTNVEGSLNEKRWQDVITLLDEGINVISAINIQHIESVNEEVQEITGAVISIKDGMECTEEEINEYCMKLPRYKRPKKLIFADVPRNATGKIEKPALRKKYGAEYLVAQQNRA